MPVLHQKINAVLFQRYGIGIILGNTLHYLHIGNVELVAAGSALIGANLAFDNDTRFLGQSLHRIENFSRNSVLRQHPLNYAGAVAKNREQQLAALAQVVEPPAKRNGLAFVLSNLRDGGYWRRHSDR